MKTGQLVYKLGKRTSNLQRMFCQDNLLVRQKSLLNVQTGQDLGSVDKFTSSKVRHSAVLVTPVNCHLVVGEEGRTKLFQISSKRLLMTYPPINLPAATSEATAYACTNDGHDLYVAYECGRFVHLNIDTYSSKFGQALREYHPMPSSHHSTTSKRPPWCHVISGMALSPKNEDCVALNIYNRELIVYNVNTGIETYMVMDSLLANTPIDDKSLLFG